MHEKIELWFWSNETQKILKIFIIVFSIIFYLQIIGMVYVGLAEDTLWSATPLTVFHVLYNNLIVKTSNPMSARLLIIAVTVPIIWGSLLCEFYRLHYKQGVYWILLLTVAILCWLFFSDTILLFLISHEFTYGSSFHYLRCWLFYADFSLIKTKLIISGLLGLTPLLLILIVRCCKPTIPNIHGKAHFATQKEVKEMGLYENRGLYLGMAYGRDLFLPGYEHGILFGPSGTWKTVANAIPNLFTWAGSIIPLDLKLTLFKLTSRYRESLGYFVYVFAPGSSFSHGYNCLDFVSKDPICRIDEVQRIAHIIIPDNPKVSDPFWYQNARLILIALIHYVLDAKEHRPTLGEINLIVKSTHNITEFVESITERSDIHYICRNNFLRFLNTNHKTHKNIVDTLLTYLAIFDNPLIEAATSRSDFDIRQLRKKPMTIYVGVNPADLERLAPLISIFYEQVVDNMLREVPRADEPYDVVLQLDEFAALRRMESFLKIGIFREYRLRAMLYIQDIAQLYAKYGMEEAKLFINTKARIAYTQIDLESSKYLESCLGTNTIEIKSKNTQISSAPLANSDRSHTTNYAARPLMLAQEIRRIPRDKALILIEGYEPIYADKVPWYKQKKFRDKMMGEITIPSLMPLANELYERAHQMTDESRKKALEIIISENAESQESTLRMESSEKIINQQMKQNYTQIELDQAL